MYIPPWPSLNPAYFFESDSVHALPYPLNSPKSTYFYVARYGIYHLFRSLGFGGHDVVLAPDYHHGNEIMAMRAAGARLIYYPVKRNLEADLDAIAQLAETQRPRVLYVTHFIGWPQPMRELIALCRTYGMMLIEDCALSLLSEYEGQPLGSFGEYSVFCLYKSVPVPNGGLIVQNTTTDSRFRQLDLRRCGPVSVAGRSAELMLQWCRTRYSRTGYALLSLKRAAARAMRSRVRGVPVGNTGFDPASANVAMSPVCRTLLRRFRYPQIKAIRRTNYENLQGLLRSKASFLEMDLGAGVCPLFFPLLVRNKQEAAEFLWKRGIDVIQFWNAGDPEAERPGSDAQFLRRHVLEIPIHQDVSPAQLDYISEQIIRTSRCRL